MYEIDFNSDEAHTLTVPESLRIQQCPWCMVRSVYMKRFMGFLTQSTDDRSFYGWVLYECGNCHKVVTMHDRVQVTNEPHFGPSFYGFKYGPQYLPNIPGDLPESIPDDVRRKLVEARNARSASAGLSIVGSTAAIDMMLKRKDLEKGRLVDRIDQAVAEGLLMKEFADWAHHIRRASNAERHADLDALPPEEEWAEKCYEFAEQLAFVWFVLPARLSAKIAATDED